MKQAIGDAANLNPLYVYFTKTLVGNKLLESLVARVALINLNVGRDFCQEHKQKWLIFG